MLKTKNHQKGFTIVELLIVIVVIGILAALVLNTFAGAQARARDTERQTDVDSISKQLEVYYSDKGFYPELTGWDTLAEARTAFGSVDEGALLAPQAPTGTATSWQTTASTAKGQYGYVATCAGGQCTKYTITWTKEKDGTTVTKNSLSGQ